MGIKLSLTIIDTKGELKKGHEKSTSFFNKTKTDNLCPNFLHIGFYNDKIILLNESINEIISEDSELNVIEQQITNTYPNCEIVHIVQFDTINLAGYVVLENGKKLRAKCVANEQIYLDDHNFTDYERSILINTKKAILETYPNIKEKIISAIKGMSEKEELIYFLTFRNKLLKDNITYHNGNFEIEFINKLILYFINNDWSGFCDLIYLKFDGIKITDKNLEIMELINLAKEQLNIQNDL